MKNRIAILGALFGDEGKGHITHAFSSDFDWIVRFNGGANAGHTIYRNGKKYVHNLLPSVDFTNPNIKSFLASGMVLDLDKLYEEIQAASKDFPNVGKSMYVDPDTFVVLPKHKEEDKAKNSHIGTTNRGIGPAYMDKISRNGIRVRNLIHDNADVIKALKNIGVNFKHVLELRKEFENSNILFEGAQGVMLDINHGTYPFVSCSDCTVSGIFSSGFGFVMPQKVYGVSKAYLTRVGEGPMPTELHGAEADNLRKIGNEFGATTGRPRRIGWLDLPALSYAITKSGITDLIITKLDILNGMDKISVCHKYKTGEPVSSNDFFTAKPAFVEQAGWKSASTKDNEIKSFLSLIEYYTGTKVSFISRGTDKKDIIQLDTNHNEVNK